MGLCFAMFVFLTFREPLASHDSNPYPNRTRIARYNATKSGIWMRFFCLQFEASRLQWSFFLTVDNFSFFTYSWSLFAYSFSFSTYSWSFFAYSGKVRLIRALTHCKQRSLTVSKKALTVNKKASPFQIPPFVPPPFAIL